MKLFQEICIFFSFLLLSKCYTNWYDGRRKDIPRMRGAKSSISSISSSFSSWTGMGRGSRWALKWRNTVGAHVILYPLTIFFLVLTYSKTSATYLLSDKSFRYQSSYPSSPWPRSANAMYHFECTRLVCETKKDILNSNENCSENKLFGENALTGVLENIKPPKLLCPKFQRG